MRPYRVQRRAAPPRMHQKYEEPPGDRGYDWDWTRLAKAYKAEHPTCETCRKRPTKEVDHVIPFRGKDDPLRLDRRNLRANCVRCHRIKTWRQRKKNRR